MNDQQLLWLQQTYAATPSELRQGLVWLLGTWLVTHPAGWLVARLMDSKKQQLEAVAKGDQDLIRPSRGFDDGGKVIGRLERFLLYLFVTSDALGAVGFLMAAKSIFRFGELSNQSNRLEAEYITIGTLTSFAVGLAIAMVVRLIALLV